MKLAQYVVQRFLSYLLVLFIGITITFFLPRLMPGDPINNYISQVQARAGQSLSPEATQQLRDSLAELYGLQGDLFTQYTNYLGRVVRFDFGPSFTYYPEPVSSPQGAASADVRFHRWHGVHLALFAFKQGAL